MIFLLSKPRALLPLAVLALSCASVAGAKRESNLRRELNAYQLPRPLAQVWPDALRVLADRGVPLVGSDRVTVGQPEQSGVGEFLARGFQTRDLGGGRLVAESDSIHGSIRYRVQGTDLGHGTSMVRYVALQVREGAATEEESRALDLELALVQRVDPAAAERMLAAAER